MFIKLTVPIMLALSLVFTDDWIMRWFGSSLAKGSITWLYYAKNLMRVPLGVVGQAVGVASFPFLAQLYSEGKLDQLNRTLNATMRGLILLLVPISALSVTLAQPVVFLIYSHTRMKAADLHATGAALAVFSLSMFAWAAQNILARGFYAARDTLTPAVTGTALTFLNLPVYWWMAHHYQYLGLAIASSVGIIAYTLLLFELLNRKTKNPEATAMVLFLFKVAAASIVGAGACFGLTRLWQRDTGWHTTLRTLTMLVLATLVGLALTAALAKLFQVDELDAYLAKLRR
jgi:putative peptidoglycan lipid II flippase